MATSHDSYYPAAWFAARGEPNQQTDAGDGKAASWPDEQLIRDLARGKDRALGELMVRYEARLTEFIRWSLNDAAEMTEDVLQEVFLQVHRSSARFAGQSTFKTWLYGLARNVCRYELRKLRRQVTWSAESSEAPTRGARRGTWPSRSPGARRGQGTCACRC